MGEEFTAGVEGGASGSFKGWNNGRKAILTGDLHSKTGRLRAGLYQDDNIEELAQTASPTRYPGQC